MKVNTIPPPEGMLTKVPIPSVNGIQFHPVEIIRNGENKKSIGLNLDELPVFAEAYDVHTNFVYVSFKFFLGASFSFHFRVNRNVY